jgi:hypothetical protein
MILDIKFEYFLGKRSSMKYNKPIPRSVQRRFLKQSTSLLVWTFLLKFGEIVLETGQLQFYTIFFELSQYVIVNRLALLIKFMVAESGCFPIVTFNVQN